MSFHEIQFPTDISRGATGGPSFSTVVISTASGSEQRIAQWSRPRRAWDVSHALQSAEMAEDLLAFFLARQGRLYGFRFQDPNDFFILDEEAQVTRSLSSTTFQLQKIYSYGGYSVTRDIKKPVLGTVKLWNGIVEVNSNSYTIDYTTGIVTFLSVPGFIPGASFEFDTPVRFNTDQMKVQYEDVDVRSWEQIPIVELFI